MASLHQLEQDLITAMKERNENKKNTLRLLISEVKNSVINLRVQGRELTDNDVNSVLTKEAKKRKESIEIFENAGRTELADAEKAELEVIESYLPKQMSREEIERIVEEVISTSNSKDFGSIMRDVMSRVKGHADGKDVSEAVKSKLS